jgi:transposase
VALADWLTACQVTSVAMESTGVYWIPIFELLEARGFEVYLVNAYHLKRVPGRKSDVLDCQWIQHLHSLGLLAGSFRPEPEMAVLRAYLRQRAMLLEHRAPHIQHMQKALQQMNVQLTPAVSDITGITGLAIIRAIVAGERDPQQLARLRQPTCKVSSADLVKALTGHYRAEHVFALQQALVLYDCYTAQVAACDRTIEQYYQSLPERFDPDDPQHPLGPDPKPDSRCKNGPSFDVRPHLFRLIGVDLVAPDGLNASTAQAFLAEVGTDMSKWPTVKHFCSWLGLAPHNDITGGKVIRRRTLKTHTRAGQLLRLAAQSISRRDSPLGVYYRRMRARVGAEQANVATAHKLARVLYHMLKHHEPFDPAVLQAADDRQHQRDVRALQRRAAKLGFTLQPALPGG